MLRTPVITLLAALTITVSGTVFGTVSARPNVVVSIHPYFDIVRQLGGEHLDATRILPVGASPHTFDPTPRDVRRIAQADLLIMNGGVGLDEWLENLVSASGATAPLIKIFDEVTFDGVGSSLLEDGQETVFINPHIWLDPTIMIQAVEVIAAALAELNPDNAAAYRNNAEVLVADLKALDAELTATLAPLEGEAFVPFHDAWPYFTRRYGLDLVVEIEPFPGREPSPRYIAYALGEIEGSGARAIFGERQLPVEPAEVVAESAGLPLYILDPEGGGATDAESYQQLMRFNARTILAALSPGLSPETGD